MYCRTTTGIGKTVGDANLRFKCGINWEILNYRDGIY